MGGMGVLSLEKPISSAPNCRSSYVEPPCSIRQFRRSMYHLPLALTPPCSSVLVHQDAVAEQSLGDICMIQHERNMGDKQAQRLDTVPCRPFLTGMIPVIAETGMAHRLILYTQLTPTSTRQSALTITYLLRYGINPSRAFNDQEFFLPSWSSDTVEHPSHPSSSPPSLFPLTCVFVCFRLFSVEHRRHRLTASHARHPSSVTHFPLEPRGKRVHALI
ncbi:hypothetical protein LZ32DRAFT_255458 [Colletotrichum eremochloae]|nr:hypothetical protein LZ32DRAFT_255458 [Colletotrichum eremochloae]